MAKQPEDYSKVHRLDLVHEIVTDPATGDKRLALRPDPRRYRVVEIKEERFLHDTLDDFLMPISGAISLIECAVQETPIGSGPSLRDARIYVASRLAEVQNRLRADHIQPYHHIDRSDEFLASLPDGAHGFAMISVDLVGSTRLSETLDVITNARVIGVVLEEIAAVVPYFDAHILKFTGDGVILYVPPPSFNIANDEAIDCALTIRRLIHDAINPSFVESGYPTIDVRIGIESGAAVAMTVGHASSKQHRDLIGKTINMACKIQATGNPGEIRIGQIAYQNMHTMWKLGCEPINLPLEWEYRFRDERPYPIHLFARDGAVV